MAKVSKLMRKLFRKDDKGDRGLQLRLRKAVTLRKVRQVVALLEAGASPLWMDDESHSSQRFRRHDWNPCPLNALLLACLHGDVETLGLLLDALFEEPQVIAHFSRAMYCLVIRHNHWKAFQRLQQCGVPLNLVSSRSSTGSSTSLASTQPMSATAMEGPNCKLPMPIFVAAEHGRHHFLRYLLNCYPHDWVYYTFEGHSLLSVATINGHYECVRVLLEREVATRKTLDDAVAIARRHRQAHVLVLLTSYLPEFVSDPEPVYKNSAELPPSNDGKDFTCQQLQWPNQVTGNRDRGSIAETVASEFDDDSRRSSLLAISSRINYDQDMNRAEEMSSRVEIEREERQVSMTWFLDEHEPVEEIQYRVDHYERSADGFGVPKSARDLAPSSSTSCTSSYQEDEAWYTVKSSDGSRQQNDDQLASDEEEVELSYESMFSVHEDKVNNMSDETPPLSEETHEKIAASRFSSIVRSDKSHKLISVRSRGFERKVLAAIEEHPAGETEA
ncbi:unnamed protein product [Peronospora effusa]|nr:unnamed protein product [Peronospora effusa]